MLSHLLHFGVMNLRLISAFHDITETSLHDRDKKRPKKFMSCAVLWLFGLIMAHKKSLIDELTTTGNKLRKKTSQEFMKRSFEFVI